LDPKQAEKNNPIEHDIKVNIESVTWLGLRIFNRDDQENFTITIRSANSRIEKLFEIKVLIHSNFILTQKKKLTKEKSHAVVHCYCD
jgi:hypothetical protein